MYEHTFFCEMKLFLKFSQLIPNNLYDKAQEMAKNYYLSSNHNDRNEHTL